jgi:hypothetical protein
MADRYDLVATLMRPRGEIRIAWREYNDSGLFLDIRCFYRNDQAGEFRPGKQGVTLRPAQLEVLIAALQTAAQNQPAASPPVPRTQRRRWNGTPALDSEFDSRRDDR